MQQSRGAYMVLVEKPGNLEEPDADGRIILKCISEK
jgi:hypothetical protein